MVAIIDMKARQIFDSRGMPTVEVDVVLEDGSFGRAAVPSGASTGTHEAVELRDGDTNLFRGKSVLKAVHNVNVEIFDALQGLDATQQWNIDQTLIRLDGTPNKSRLGANAILGASLAIAKAAAISYGMPLFRYLGGMRASRLPIPLVNILNGGCHADNALDIQEFMIVPIQEGKTFSEKFEMVWYVFQSLKDILKKKGFSTNTGDEGGFAPALTSTKAALDVLMEAISGAGFTPGEEIGIALDVAASELYKDGKYHLDGRVYASDELVEFYETLTNEYPVVSIEDGMAEDDWNGWQALHDALTADTQLVGDDLFVTNLERLEKGLELGVANAILIKPNQIGTLSETALVIETALDAGYNTVMSHRSGETEDTTIADLAVAFGCGQIKTGSLSRTDRLVKYNQLFRIEEEVRAMLGSALRA